MAGRWSRVARKPPTNASARATLMVAIRAVSWGNGRPSHAALRIEPDSGASAGGWAVGRRAIARGRSAPTHSYDDVLAALAVQQQAWQLLQLADLPGVEQQAGVEDRAIRAQRD